MVPLASLALPILLSAVLVFFVSSLMWSLPWWHKKDWQRIPQEDLVMSAIAATGIGSGQYTFPEAGARSPKTWSDEDARKVRSGPMGALVLWPPGPPRMGRTLSLWFVQLIVVSLLVAYIASRTLGPGTTYTSVFRLTGVAAALGYAGYVPANAIFFGQPWSATGRSIVDGIIYGLLTAGAFGWLWPEV